MKIRNAGMPQIQSAFNGWQNRVCLMRHIENVIDGFVEITEKPLSLYGTIQPLNPRAIELKPEGQRSWTWLQIHCQSRAITLIPGDKIKWQGELYKIMQQLDYGLNGYIELHAVKDWQQGVP